MLFSILVWWAGSELLKCPKQIIPLSGWALWPCCHSGGPSYAGKANHTEIIQYILNNTIALQWNCSSHKFWVNESSGYVLIHLSVPVMTCDQPECHTISGLLAGNSASCWIMLSH
jgi:hypothetical protein